MKSKSIRIKIKLNFLCFIISRNAQNLELQYLVGYNNDGHQNLIWNYMNGWFAYSIENMVKIIILLFH